MAGKSVKKRGGTCSAAKAGRTAGKAKGPIRILHLSDFHFCAEKKWDSDPVLMGLAEVIAEKVSPKLPPDVVVITGDIANKGRAEDYAEAKRWIDGHLLPALPDGFTKDRLLIVPGNHDVDRKVVKMGAQAMQSKLLADADQMAIGTLMEDSEERGMLLKRHDAFLEFANGYRTKKTAIEVPWWSSAVECGNGQVVHLAGLCSSWMSWGDKDYGNLLLSCWQVNELLKEAKKADWSVALLHHPWNHLAMFDQEKVEERIHRNCDAVLRGHLHKPKSRAEYSATAACVTLAAGSCYAGSDYPNGFQVVELESNPRRVCVHFWMWDEGQWIRDRNVCPEDEDGVAVFELEGGLKRGKSGGSTSTSLDTRKYLECLRERTGYIDIRGLKVGSGKAQRFGIEQLYIPLTTSMPKDPDESRVKGGMRPGDERMEREQRVALHEALERRQLAITGDPGSGKSTFLNRIAYNLCLAHLDGGEGEGVESLGLEDCPFPLLIKLSELGEHIAACRERKVGPVAADSPAWLAHFLARGCEECETGLNEEFFLGQLREGTAIVLLDGLDEASTDVERKLLSNLVRKASGEAYRECRFVLTSRPGAYRGETTLEEFDRAQIDSLEDEAIDSFLSRWCSALFDESPGEAQKHLDELHRALAAVPEIGRMARNPVMLTALAVVHWHEKKLPEQRADLYESILGWLSCSRESRAGRPSADRCLALHQELALAMQDHPDGRQVDVPRHWAAQQLAGEWRELPEQGRFAMAEEFIDQEELDSGIVVRRGHDVRFWHLTFQEYLAARALAACPEAEQRNRLLGSLDKLTRPEWRETVLLLAGVLFYQGRKRVDSMFGEVLGLVGGDALLADRARCFGLLGAAVKDLAPVNYTPSDERYEKLASDVLGIFDRDRALSVKIEDAIEAAEALGQVGDPRLSVEAVKDNWVTIPGGSFLMGAQSDDPTKENYDQAAYDDESPVHRVTVPEFRIGRYPVTVAEYMRFMEGGGYEDKSYWEAGGVGEWKEPSGWEEQKGHPNRPVVGVSWYEASAYASWAGCRLLTEAEWEYTARGEEGRGYPWGNDKPDSRRGNYNNEIGRPTPVGVYAAGNTPDGISDMAGNVWEWCSDVWRDNYEGAPADGSARAADVGESESGRVVRGGAWHDVDVNVRCAGRFRSRPANRLYYIGFRVAAGT